MDRRYIKVLLLLMLMLIYFVGHSYGSRHTQVFKVHPKDKALPPNIFGFLPKAVPIPPSGPSRKHNSIGLQSSMGAP
ncbi:hypothetical protein Fmac_023668 [Flemingia macrophylla]|uniref:Uncharacterized protein n=1 Tax=Flemingia macrophylla TaxID=520843 RepID=A0ABD1LM64_9FABA